MDPIRRSTKGFCHGDRGALMMTATRSASTRRSCITRGTRGQGEKRHRSRTARVSATDRRQHAVAAASAFGPASVPVQVLAVRQGDHVLAFSYGLPMGRKPYGDHAVDRYIEP